MCSHLSGLCTFTVSYIFVDAGTLVSENVLLIAKWPFCFSQSWKIDLSNMRVLVR